MSKITFNNAKSPFFDSLKSKVENYFRSQQITQTGNSHLYSKTIILISLLVSIYLVVLLVPVPTWVTFALFAVLGLVIASIGFNVMHDGAHGSYSKKKWVNEVMGNSLSLLGGSIFMWKAKHNIIHHTYTNIEGMDDDIDIKPWMRTHPEQPRYWFHKYQHIYWVVLYSLLYILWVFLFDFQKYFSGKIGQVKFRKMDTRDHILFWTSKLVSIFLLFVLPFFVLGWFKALIGLAVMGICSGITISTVFQLAHIVEDVQFPKPNETTNKIEEEWAVHQVQTTANFATRSKFVSWFVGGLNFQVEHHLFPKISHIHYPQINKFVIETCEEFKIQYKEFPNLVSAVRSHVVHLKQVAAA